MTKSQHKRTAVASMFQNGISQNTKCAVKGAFCRDSHIFIIARIKPFLQIQSYMLFSGVSTVEPSGARAPLTFSLLNVIVK